MVSDIALSISSAGTNARIIALVVSTGSVLRTVTVDHTLRTAFSIRIALILWRTLALAFISNLSRRKGTSSTWVGVAWIAYDWFRL